MSPKKYVSNFQHFCRQPNPQQQQQLSREIQTETEVNKMNNRMLMLMKTSKQSFKVFISPQTFSSGIWMQHISRIKFGFSFSTIQLRRWVVTSFCVQFGNGQESTKHQLLRDPLLLYVRSICDVFPLLIPFPLYHQLIRKLCVEYSVQRKGHSVRWSKSYFLVLLNLFQSKRIKRWKKTFKKCYTRGSTSNQVVHSNAVYFPLFLRFEKKIQEKMWKFQLR